MVPIEKTANVVSHSSRGTGPALASRRSGGRDREAEQQLTLVSWVGRYGLVGLRKEARESADAEARRGQRKSQRLSSSDRAVRWYDGKGRWGWVRSDEGYLARLLVKHCPAYAEQRLFGVSSRAIGWGRENILGHHCEPAFVFRCRVVVLGWGGKASGCLPRAGPGELRSEQAAASRVKI